MSNKICAFCVQGKGPGCTTGICLDGECVTIQACSLDLYGSCSAGSSCITNRLCEKCKKHMEPQCTQGLCLNGQCAQISPCSIRFI
ncbi:hypothetical protein I4U23_004746 [Adineta vaga]|nr:hypothetical protein I4U23_004746 [Adineta vaga]